MSKREAGGAGAPGDASKRAKVAGAGASSSQPSAFEDELLELEAEMAGEAGGSAAPSGAAAPKDDSRWGRPAMAPVDASKDDVAFQWVDIDMYTGKPLKANPAAGRPVLGSAQGPVPILRFYGVTEAGNSVLLHVHGVTPYCYVQAPAGFRADNVGAFRAALEQQLSNKAKKSEPIDTCVLGVDFVQDKSSLLGYQFGRKIDLLKVYVAVPTLIPPLRRLCEEGVDIPGVGRRMLQTFESNVAFLLRFMIDHEITGANWLEVKAGTFAVRPPAARTSHCQCELDVVFDSLLSHACEGEWNKIAPLRILSFDIECMGRKGHFPEADQDPVIQIANVVKVQGQEVPAIRNVFTLDTCNPIVGAEVLAFRAERDLLAKWAAFVRACDYDILTGYNIQNFDVPYIFDRMNKLKLGGTDALCWGRIKGAKVRMRDTTFQSSAYGKRENKEATIDGRCMFDVLPYMFRNHKLSSYSLNAVSAEFLGQQKEDVHHSIISDLQRGSAEDRRRLAVYCLKDAWLPVRLLDKLSVLINYIEMARVTGVPVDFLITRGQQIKVMSMLLRKARAGGLVIPTIKKGGDQEGGYEGATVIEPIKAYYQEPIATLDFASLYPSIMMAYNLCYSTLVAKADVVKLDPDQVVTSPCKDVFVNAKTHVGLLPKILKEILAARKRAKKDMKAATDPMEKAVQNGRQLALKVSANSVYGFTGATVGQLPCLPIAASTTAYGRDLLFQTRTVVEERYTEANGYKKDAVVVYGDTDSVMIKFGAGTVGETMDLAMEAADFVTAKFPPPVKLEFEKVYMPYLLMNKKRYAGLLWTRPDKHDYMDSKGLELVRRDNCLLVRKMVDKVLRMILINRDVSGAIEYAKSTIADLLQNKLDISYLVITKQLSKMVGDADYKAKSAHAELAHRMLKRDPASAPKVGDRVPYVVTQKAKGAPMFEKSEDPIYAMKNSIPLDYKYYLENQLSQPLIRIFTPIIDNPESLLNGDHTRSIYKPTPKAVAGGIMMFAVKKAACLACKVPISSVVGEGQRALCEHCKPREGVIYVEKLAAVSAAEVEHSKLWTQCQRCQGNMHEDVICQNGDCPIFFRRTKAQIDLQTSEDALARFTF